MTSQTTRRIGSAALQRRRAKINAQIAALGLPLPGSLVEQRTRRPNTSCHYHHHGNPPRLYGPHLIWTRKAGNKTLTRTPDTTQADVLRPLMNDSRQLRELTTKPVDCRAMLWMTTWTRPKSVTVGDDGRPGLDLWREESIASCA